MRGEKQAWKFPNQLYTQTIIHFSCQYFTSRYHSSTWDHLHFLKPRITKIVTKVRWFLEAPFSIRFFPKVSSSRTSEDLKRKLNVVFFTSKVCVKISQTNVSKKKNSWILLKLKRLTPTYLTHTKGYILGENMVIMEVPCVNKCTIHLPTPASH